MSRALAQYGTILRHAAAGRSATVELLRSGQPARPVHPADWCNDLRPGDHGLLARCAGPTLDVGCGPGRLTAAVVAAGYPALGVDTSAEAVRQSRRRGAPVRHSCVFSPLPGEGTWHHVLLADGNIGIGGDPYRLLARCRQLLHRDGAVLVELDPPGTVSWQGLAALRYAGRTGPAFPWAVVGADDVDTLAAGTGLSTVERWTEANRCFARLAAG